MSVTGASGFSDLSAARRSPQKRKNALAGRLGPEEDSSFGGLAEPDAAFLTDLTARRGFEADDACTAGLGGVAGRSEAGFDGASLPRFTPRDTFGLDTVGLLGFGSGPPADDEALPVCAPWAVASLLSFAGFALSFLLLYASALARAFAASCLLAGPETERHVQSGRVQSGAPARAAPDVAPHLQISLRWHPFRRPLPCA